MKAQPTLTLAEANTLYVARRALREARSLTITTRTALYEWSETLHVYVCMSDELRVQHRAGAVWSRLWQCFVPCTCQWCAEHPDKVAAVELYRP